VLTKRSVGIISTEIPHYAVRSICMFPFAKAEVTIERHRLLHCEIDNSQSACALHRSPFVVSSLLQTEPETFPSKVRQQKSGDECDLISTGRYLHVEVHVKVSLC